MTSRRQHVEQSRRGDVVVSWRRTVVTLDPPPVAPSKLEGMSANASQQAAFDGFASPNFTQVPDELFDVLLPQLTDCELRVLLYIVRRTFGFKRDHDAISLSQMVNGITTRQGQVLDRGTGLSKATVARGLAKLRARGVILAERRSSAERGDEATNYRLRFKPVTPDNQHPTDPLSHQRDTAHSRPPVSMARQTLSRSRDTQQTEEQKTDFESSIGKAFVDKTEAERLTPPQSRSKHDQTGSGGMESVADSIKRRVVRRAVSDDHQAIGATIQMFADELGDRAGRKATVSRAMNLFAESGLGREAFVDLLYQVRGEVRDRRRDPGKAPRPANPMAYFFAVVEDRLGLRAPLERS